MSLNSIKSKQRKMRMLALAVDGTGTAALSGPDSGQATLTDNGVGDYTITFSESFANTPVAVATTQTADSVLQISSISATALTVKAFDATDGTTAKDVDFQLMIMGSDVADKY